MRRHTRYREMNSHVTMGLLNKGSHSRVDLPKRKKPRRQAGWSGPAAVIQSHDFYPLLLLPSS